MRGRPRFFIAQTALALLFASIPAVSQEEFSSRDAAGNQTIYLRSEIPGHILDSLTKAISFALKVGAAREVSGRDLFHAHALFEERNGDKSDKPEYAEALLLHAQEYVVYSASSRRKRNIFVRIGGRPKILPCPRPLDNFPAELEKERIAACTVYPIDLGMVISLADCTIYFVNVDTVPPSRLLGYERNIREIGGRKILFGIAK